METLNTNGNSNITAGTQQSQPPLSVIIVGGGLGGLAAALALQKRNIECRVFERDPEISTRRQGYGLTLTNNIKGPLAELVRNRRGISCRLQ